MTLWEAISCCWRLYKIIRRHAIKLDKVLSKLEELTK